jgi:serine/threonine protein kinase
MLGKTALGKYTLLRSLGAGSNAEVFLAQPVRYPSHRVVVKRVHDHVVDHPKFCQLFEAEVRSMANFHHPYAVRLMEASLDDPIGPCLVLEYVPGMTLEALLARHRRLFADRVGRLLAIFCHALQAAHDAGIVHRDLKPSNLMVTGADTSRESGKVMDFGFAGFAAKPHIQLAELTGHGPIFAIGTPGYVSPEMIRGDRVDSRSDIYSLGVILYEMLTGRLPFEYDRQDKLLAAHVREAPPGFRKIGCGHVGPAVEAVVQLALSKFPNERQQSVRELAHQFGRALGTDVWQETTPVNWTPAPPRPLHHTPAPVATPAPAAAPTDPFRVKHEFSAMMPERLAAAKLRGFVEDIGAEVLASEPGLIRLRVGLPAGYQERPATGGSSIMNWINAMRRPTVQPGKEPIAVELHLERPDPVQPRLNVVVAFGPVKEYPPKDRPLWHARCDKLFTILRQYLGA